MTSIKEKKLEELVLCAKNLGFPDDRLTSLEAEFRKILNWKISVSRARSGEKKTQLQILEEDPSLLEKFWKNINVLGLGDCWEWKGAIKRYSDSKGGGDHGTPVMTPSRAATAGTRPYIRAARVALWLHTGDWPDIKTNAIHGCGNKKCLNPHHLYWGRTSGSSHNFTYEERQQIKKEIMLAHNMSPVARKYNLTPAFVSVVSRGLAWKDVVVFDNEGLLL